MTFMQFLSILRARWAVALSVLLLTVGLVFAVTLILPKKYAATASVVVDVKPDPVAAMLSQGAFNPGVMATQVDVIQSDRVAVRVVRNLRLADNAQIRSQWQADTGGLGSIEQWIGQSFQKSLEVKPSRESNVINVTYRAPDPRFAAALANAFVQAYLEVVLELRVDPAKSYSSFFDNRAKESRDALEKSQAKLSAYQKANGIIAADERFDIENSRLNELSTQLVMVQAISAESGSRQAQATGASADRMQEVLQNPVVSSLKADLSRSGARLQELNSKFGANHPQVIEAEASMADLRSKLEAETRRVTGGVGVSNNINRQRESEIRASLEAQRAKVLRMKAMRDEGAVLVREVETAQRSYEQVLLRLNQVQLESQTTQSNAVMLSQADAPFEPSSPKVLLSTLVAVLVGAVLAIATALFLEILDRRVRSADDAVLALGLPVLGVLPKPRTRGLFGPAKTSKMHRRLLGQSGLKEAGA